MATEQITGCDGRRDIIVFVLIYGFLQASQQVNDKTHTIRIVFYTFRHQTFDVYLHLFGTRFTNEECAETRVRL